MFFVKHRKHESDQNPEGQQPKLFLPGERCGRRLVWPRLIVTDSCASPNVEHFLIGSVKFASMSLDRPTHSIRL